MTIMSIAGFDPSGGAGVLNDIKTFHALNVYGTGVITALTAQNVKRLDDILPVNCEFIEKQIDIILEEESFVHHHQALKFKNMEDFQRLMIH